ncbi:GMC family oxidoreductase [Roseomonas nepalensis]|uniref:GMC family oxidoreductase n=1 Tax=Muricoccus nepalensis TaxID=1854500 RepID=A0A502GER7_9PROT|nr:GMC family oxidoreductase [Roseomonas nepalensis]TPG59203.1 GMC family oxidoreductase [Roseomonas nepalensis]
MRRLPRKDVVIVGLGWTGAIMGYELCQAGLQVVALERGPWRDTASDFNIGTAPDELRYAIRNELFVRPSQDTVTARNTPDQTALPIRRWGSFLPGNGVGGSGVHWNGHTWRFLPSDLNIRSHYKERYGEGIFPENHMIQDWGIGYDELEPYYDKFEYLCGIAGQAGNIKGQIQPGGNPFEGWRQRGYPTPPLKMQLNQDLFTKATTELGMHPFPLPAANMSQAYTNPLGVTQAPCTYCGFCERFGCANYSKSSPQTTILPVLMRHPGFEARTECEVMRVLMSPDGKTATGVTYIDAQGQEWEQPADLVILAAYQLWNVRLLLYSGIGKPYDVSTGEGVVGKNYAYQANSSVNGFFDDKLFNSWAGAGALGMTCDDYQGDAFDHTGLNFVGGANINGTTFHARPISARPVPPGTPRWGSAWKKATRDNYNTSTNVGSQGSVMSYRDCYLDLDPTYKDRLGRPLLRMTFDFKPNEERMSAYVTEKMVPIMRAMGAKHIVASPKKGPWSVVPYQTTHNTGGAIMGDNPRTSAVNKFQQTWDVPNVFVLGASAFPQNAGYNPTGTVGALAYYAADAIKGQYLKNPGQPLVQA